jgi:hypothetical protein
MDRATWQLAAVNDPGEDQEETLPVDLDAAWLRAKVVLDQSGLEWPTVTCYAVGYLQKRGRP